MEIPSVDFVFVRQKDCHDKAFGYDTVNSKELLGTGKHVLFALPGAFTPTCTQFQLPSFESSYNNFKEEGCLLYTSPSPRDRQKYRMPYSA